MFSIYIDWQQKYRQMSALLIITLLVALVLMLTACKFGTPFSGPINEMKKLSSNETAVIALSYVRTGDDSAKNIVFWDYVMEVNDNLPKQKGYLGHSIRRVVLGKEGWTMTVWENEQSLNEFVRGDLHQRAIDKSLNAVAKARFARATVKRSEVPISWEKAEQLLVTQGRDLY
jgi:heme-degrading monooxygenase HmoA